MQVGDLVRFNDVSSKDTEGNRSFPEIDGRVGLVLKVRTDKKSGTVLVYTDLERRYLRDGLSDRGFNARYYEVVNVATR